MTIPELKELNEQIPSMDCTALQCALRETVSQLTEILSAMETSSEAQKEMLRQFQEMKETCKTQKHEIDRLNRLVNRLSGQLCIEKTRSSGENRAGGRRYTQRPFRRSARRSCKRYPARG